MKYTEFETSARRHLESCYHILDNLINSTESFRKQKEDRLILNIYYLSGYVIECSLKFAFFKAVKFSKNDKIELNQIIRGTDYDMKTHSLRQLVSYLPVVDTSLPRDIPMLTQTIPDVSHKTLANQWNSEIRYSPDYARTKFAIDSLLMKEYLDNVVKPIFEKLTRR